MQQAKDFLEESEDLEELLLAIKDQDYEVETQFKRWTISDILRHLHLFNQAAELTLKDGTMFQKMFLELKSLRAEGASLLEAQRRMLDDLSGRELFEKWREGCRVLAKNYYESDPKKRVLWAGPNMSARSSITARQMETWAHGQAIYDLFGLERVESDRIKNIVHLGVKTFGWTFVNRGLAIPETAPHIKLISPSGNQWEWNEFQEQNIISGLAVDFAQVVTQVRNVADTKLLVEGKSSCAWMAIAQCFAGDAEDPPKKGGRGVFKRRA